MPSTSYFRHPRRLGELGSTGGWLWPGVSFLILRGLWRLNETGAVWSPWTDFFAWLPRGWNPLPVPSQGWFFTRPVVSTHTSLPPAQPGWGWPGLDGVQFRFQAMAVSHLGGTWRLPSTWPRVLPPSPRNNSNDIGLAHQLTTSSNLSALPLEAVRFHFRDEEPEAWRMAEHLPMVT